MLKQRHFVSPGATLLFTVFCAIVKSYSRLSDILLFVISFPRRYYFSLQKLIEVLRCDLSQEAVHLLHSILV